MHLLLVYRLVSVYDVPELSDGGAWPVLGYDCEKPTEPFYDRYEPHISLKRKRKQAEPIVNMEGEEEREGGAHVGCVESEASIYSPDDEVSARVSKGIPTPASPIDSREKRDIQISMSSSVQPPCRRLASVSSS